MIIFIHLVLYIKLTASQKNVYRENWKRKIYTEDKDTSTRKMIIFIHLVI